MAPSTSLCFDSSQRSSGPLA
uniref:Uncharacterized protein n=1 Tax=Arundo donax TaxID=35708 RepID=A0A0A9A2M5_ARUDO